MITRAEAEAIASRWARGEADQRGYGCEPALAEFDVGFIIWTRPTPDVLPIPGDGARTVIDRETGVLSTWPSIPPDEIADLYRARRPRRPRTVDPAVALRRAATRRPTPTIAAEVTVGGRVFRAQGAKGDQQVTHHPRVADRLAAIPAAARVRGAERHAELIAASEALYAAGELGRDAVPDARERDDPATAARTHGASGRVVVLDVRERSDPERFAAPDVDEIDGPDRFAAFRERDEPHDPAAVGVRARDDSDRFATFDTRQRGELGGPADSGVRARGELVGPADSGVQGRDDPDRLGALDEGERSGLGRLAAFQVREAGDPEAGGAARPCATCLAVLVGLGFLPHADLAFTAEWRHGSDRIPHPGRFPHEVARVLAGGGWLGVAMPVSAVIAQVEDLLGGPVFPAARQVLAEFAGVRCGRRGPGSRRAIRLLTFDPLPGARQAAALAEFAEVVGVPVVPIATEGGDGVVVLDERGRVFVLDQAGEWFVGTTFDEAVTALLTGDGPADRLRDDGTW